MTGNTEYLQKLFDESHTQTNDEAVIAKLADYLEVTHYKLFVNRYTPGDLVMAKKSLTKVVEKISNPKVKKIVKDILQEWEVEMQNPSPRAV
jgi:hypothetical protein